MLLGRVLPVKRMNVVPVYALEFYTLPVYKKFAFFAYFKLAKEKAGFAEIR